MSSHKKSRPPFAAVTGQIGQRMESSQSAPRAVNPYGRAKVEILNKNAVAWCRVASPEALPEIRHDIARESRMGKLYRVWFVSPVHDSDALGERLTVPADAVLPIFQAGQPAAYVWRDAELAAIGEQSQARLAATLRAREDIATDADRALLASLRLCQLVNRLFAGELALSCVINKLSGNYYRRDKVGRQHLQALQDRLQLWEVFGR